MAEWVIRWDSTGDMWYTNGITDSFGSGIWVVLHNEGWTVELTSSSNVLAGPFETKEAAMLAAELLFE